jgi:PPOX class probable F420-dependent enzyme
VSATLRALPGWASDLLAAEPVARLGLLDEQGEPRVLPVTFALAGGWVWTAIDHKPKRSAEPARVRRLRRRPQATLLVDRYHDDWSRLAWVELRGRVDVLDAAAARQGLDALQARYEQYAGARPAGPVLRLEPRASACWRAADGPG